MLVTSLRASLAKLLAASLRSFHAAKYPEKCSDLHQHMYLHLYLWLYLYLNPNLLAELCREKFEKLFQQLFRKSFPKSDLLSFLSLSVSRYRSLFLWMSIQLLLKM
jgi:hypothetical protein